MAKNPAAGAYLPVVLDTLNRLSALAAGLAILAMMIAGAGDVILTNIDMIGLESRPIAGVHEFMASMMVVAVALAVPLAQARRQHIRVTLVLAHLPLLPRTALTILGHGLAGLLFGLIAWFGWQTTGHAFAVGEFAAGLYDVPLWPARCALALGATLMTAQCVYDIATAYAGGDIAAPLTD